MRVATGRASDVKPSQMFSMRVVSDFMPNRSRSGITTTVISEWAPRATGEHATWMQRKGGKQWKRKKERNEERKKSKKIKLRDATLNVGTMTCKGREVADFMERRGVCNYCYPSHAVWRKVLAHSANSIAVSKGTIDE